MIFDMGDEAQSSSYTPFNTNLKTAPIIFSDQSLSAPSIDGKAISDFLKCEGSKIANVLQLGKALNDLLGQSKRIQPIVITSASDELKIRAAGAGFEVYEIKQGKQSSVTPSTVTPAVVDQVRKTVRAQHTPRETDSRAETLGRAIDLGESVKAKENKIKETNNEFSEILLNSASKQAAAQTAMLADDEDDYETTINEGN